jgi:hypothetical protein
LFAAFRSNSTFGTVVGASGITALALDGLVIHAIHGRPEAAVGSLALRVGGTLIGGLIGMSTTTPCPTGGTGLAGIDELACQLDSLGPIALGMGLGLLAASAIDVTVLSWEKARPPRPDADDARAPRIAPVATVVRQPGGPAGVMVGVVGAL